MRSKNEVTIVAAEIGAVVVNEDNVLKETKPGVIQLNCDLFELAVYDSPDFDKNSDTRIILQLPATLKVVLFGREQVIELNPPILKPLEIVRFRKEGWFELENGDMIEGIYDHVHKDGKPVYASVKLSDDSVDSVQTKPNNNTSVKSGSVRDSDDSGNDILKHNNKRK